MTSRTFRGYVAHDKEPFLRRDAVSEKAQRNLSIGTQSLCAAWTSVLPPNVSVVSGPIRADAAPLTRLESLSAGKVSPVRLRELATGRDYAKQALAALGYNGVQLPIGADRSPVWPSGIVGSITHANSPNKTHCAAAVGYLAEINSIGIDVEPDTFLDPEIWTTILTAHELAEILDLAANDRSAEVLRRWCVKEAIAKASRLFLEPGLIKTAKLHPSGRDYLGLTQNSCWQARTARAEGFVLAAVTISRN